MKLDMSVGGHGSERGRKGRLDVSGRPSGGVRILSGEAGIRLLVLVWTLPELSCKGWLGRLVHTESTARTDRKYAWPHMNSEKKVEVSLVLSWILWPPLLSAVTM